MTTINTISDCVSNGFLFIAKIDENGQPRDALLALHVFSAMPEVPFGTVKDARAAVNAAEGIFFAGFFTAPIKHSYEGFFIAAEVDDKGELTGQFLIFTSTGEYKAGPFASIKAAQDEIDKWVKENKLSLNTFGNLHI